MPIMRRFLAFGCILLWFGSPSRANVSIDLPRSTATRSPQGSRWVVLETSMGRIKIELFADKAPITVRNFLGYVDGRFYDGTIFHRVIDGFMIQGGGWEPGMKEKKAREPIKNEAANRLSNARGTIAAARAAAPDSATCQFYINLKDNTFLDRKNSRDQVGYCVFGKVVEGMDVVDRIAKVQTGIHRMHRDVPKNDVVIRSIRRGW
jgi:peptidyl-prolyl cis-trans isomerase B (cyclophilin B)